MRAARDLLARALERRGPCRILTARERPWASATFVGARHRVRLVVEPAFLEGIEGAEFDLGEYLLADIIVVGREWVEDALIADIEALTIEDWRPSAPTPAQEATRSRGSQRLWPLVPACAEVEERAEDGWTEPERQTTCGTKRAFVPLAAA